MADDTDILDAENQRTIRERVTKLAFDGDPQRYDEFVRELNDATPDGVEWSCCSANFTFPEFIRRR